MNLKSSYQKVTDTIYVHFLWVLTSLLGLLITFGAASAALSKVMFKIYNDDEPTYVFQTFKKSFIENFVISTKVWLLILVVGIATYFMTFSAFKNNNNLLKVISVVIAFEISVFTFFVFPIISVFVVDGIISLFKNTFLMMSKYLFISFQMIGSFVVIFLLMYYASPIFIILLLVSYGFITTFYLRKAFETLKREILNK